jgi:hypothetical protein
MEMSVGPGKAQKLGEQKPSRQTLNVSLHPPSTHGNSHSPIGLRNRYGASTASCTHRAGHSQSVLREHASRGAMLPPQPASPSTTPPVPRELPELVAPPLVLPPVELPDPDEPVPEAPVPEEDVPEEAPDAVPDPPLLVPAPDGAVLHPTPNHTDTATKKTPCLTMSSSTRRAAAAAEPQQSMRLKPRPRLEAGD